MKKFISLFVILCMCMTALIACTTEGNDDITTPGADTTTPEGEVTSAAITGDMTKGNLEGETIKFLAWSDSGNLEFEYDDSNVDQATINDAILLRNTNVKNRLNCELEFIYSKGNYDNQQVYITKA